MSKGSVGVGDKVQVHGDAESCCCANDAGLFGVVVKVKNPMHVVVRTSAGEWAHCPKCISLMSDRNVEDHQN